MTTSDLNTNSQALEDGEKVDGVPGGEVYRKKEVITGGPYAMENDIIDEALRDGTLEYLAKKDVAWSEGAKTLIKSYQNMKFESGSTPEKYEAPVGDRSFTDVVDPEVKELIEEDSEEVVEATAKVDPDKKAETTVVVEKKKEEKTIEELMGDSK